MWLTPSNNVAMMELLRRPGDAGPASWRMVAPWPACRALPCILARPDDPLLAWWCGYPLQGV